MTSFSLPRFVKATGSNNAVSRISPETRFMSEKVYRFMNEPPLIRNIHNIGIPRSVTGRTARAEAAKIGASQPSAGGQGRFHESAGGAEHPRAVVPDLVQH